MLAHPSKARTHSHTSGPQELEVALGRARSAVAGCTDMGPFRALMHEGEVMAEFVDAAGDMLAALKGLNAKALKVRARGYAAPASGLP